MDGLRSLLFQRTDPRALALFRILFGSLMLYEVFFYASSGLIEVGIVGPRLLFPYEGFEWLHPMPLSGMRSLVGVMALSCLLIIIGAIYRIAMSILFGGLTYIFLLDKAYYNNHTYLFVLLAFLMIWLPADRAWAVGRKGQVNTVPYWCWMILRLQIVIVYFFGGIAKLDPDWLVRGEPMRTMLMTNGYGSAPSEILLSFLVIGGMLFDLLAGPLLWWKKTRRYMIPFVIFFNITNHFLFDDIGVFPFFMMAATILFFDPQEIAKWFGNTVRPKKAVTTEALPGGAGKITAFLSIYLLFQLLFPLRWIALAVDPDWTSVAQRFSWRMKISTRAPLMIAFNVEEPMRNDSHPVQLQDFINNYQQQLCAYDPRSAVRLAKWLRSEAERRGMKDIRITSRIVISFNGRPYRYLFPPDQDLSLLDGRWMTAEKWMAPLDATELELPEKEVKRLLMEKRNVRT